MTDRFDPGSMFIGADASDDDSSDWDSDYLTASGAPLDRLTESDRPSPETREK